MSSQHPLIEGFGFDGQNPTPNVLRLTASSTESKQKSSRARFTYKPLFESYGAFVFSECIAV